METNVPKPVQAPATTGQIVIEDAKLISIKEKIDATVAEGRKKSIEIDETQKRIDELTEEEMKLTAEVEPQDLIERGDQIRDKINDLIKDLELVAEQMKEQKLAAIPEEMKEEHLKLNDKMEKLSEERNKLALKVQKLKDRLIPKIQKVAKKELGEFEDFLSAELEDGKIVVKKFSHLEEWKKRWKEKQS